MIYTVNEDTSARANVIAAGGSVRKWIWSPSLAPKPALLIASRISPLVGSDHETGTVNQNWIGVVSKFPTDVSTDTFRFCHKASWRQVRKSVMTRSAVIPSGIWKIPLESAHPWASRIQFPISSPSSSRSLNQETESTCCARIGAPQGGIGRLGLSPLYARTLGGLTGPLSVYEPPQLRKILISLRTLPALPYGGIRSATPECSESTIANTRKVRI